MNERTFKLSFKAPVHFGMGRLSDGVCCCDAATLFSALFIEAMRLGVDSELLDAVHAGDLLISDAFPFAGDTLYLPKPMLMVEHEDEPGHQSDSRARKASKKLPYIPAARMGEYLSGRLDVITVLNQYQQSIGKPFLQTKVNLTYESKPEADPYHVGGFVFKPAAGIYFIARGSYDLTPLLDQLQYSGIGGERTSGYGRFEYSVQLGNPAGKVSAAGETRGVGVLLSTAMPTDNELCDSLLDGARYRLVRRSGFVQSPTYATTPQKRRDMYPFAAGSVFVKRFAGDVYDASTQRGGHPVWRYARAMWMEV